MKMNFLEPEKLRPEIMRRIEAMDDSSLLLLHHVLLEVEKERNWRELSSQPDLDRGLGSRNRLTGLIHEAEADLRSE
jgi:hypothetical protein